MVTNQSKSIRITHYTYIDENNINYVTDLDLTLNYQLRYIFINTTIIINKYYVYDY